MNQPKRIQCKRTKGWTMPEGAVYVGRSSKWWNPYYAKKHFNSWYVCLGHDVKVSFPFRTREEAIKDAVRRFGDNLQWRRDLDVTELRGKDLCCWCKEGDPCHADVLLELANREVRP